MAPALIPDFVPAWIVLLALGLFLYVLLDGFDLGVGILYSFAPDSEARSLIMSSIAPIWDGNETWLVLSGLALYAAFPLAFSIILPAVYFPVLIMLLALVFRGVAFEFRYKDAPHRTFWDHAFAYGSAVATFAQGIVIGSFIQGYHVEAGRFAGSSIDCFTPFSIFTGFALLFGYGLIGAGWLILKTEGSLQAWARRMGRWTLLGVLIAIATVSAWTPLLDRDIEQRWFTWPDIAIFTPVPILTVLLAYWAWRALARPSSNVSPFLAGIGLFVLTYSGIAISLWPMIVPHHYSIWEAASAPSTQVFLLVGTLFLLPIILMYTGWSYWVFRGKVRADIGYH